MRYEVNANTFMQLPYTTGTIQNVSNTDIEISNEQTIGTGIVLKAGETFAFNNATVYACARPVLNGGTGIISVVPFNGEGEGGESPIYVPKGSIAFASLPTTINSTMLGWTYNISDAFTTDNRFVEGSGIDYPAGENVVVVEASTGVFKYDCFGGAYILPVANTTTLGGVKSSAIDGKVSVDNDGVMTINLPTASMTVKGGAKIGTGFSMSGEVLNLDVASTSALGGIKVGTGVEVVNEKLNVKVATANEVAGVLSSADEGKVMVNNDGTMTYNPLGYRQPSTAYTVGNIAYHSALPTGWYLECTTEGTSGSGDLTISSPAIGNTVTDGNVTWKIGMPLSLNGGTMTGSILHKDSEWFNIYGGQSSTVASGIIQLGSPAVDGRVNIIAKGADSTGELLAYPDGKLKWNGNDIVALYPTAAAHNSIYRGKDLTAYMESGGMSTAIANGTFTDIYPGDYIIKSITIDGTTYSNVKFIVMDLDYHLHCGDTETTAHHVVIMPEEALGSAQMNTEHTTAGGYLGSKMWTEHMPKVTAGFEAAFGAAHILEHRELLSNAMDANLKSNAYDGWSGATSEWAWASVKANLANEDMVYGASVASSSVFDVGECNSQLAAFRLNRGLVCSMRRQWWLRSGATASHFCAVDAFGGAGTSGAAGSRGVRPITLLR